MLSSLLLFRSVIFVLALIPILAGLGGLWSGTLMVGAVTPVDVASHFRYLSGLLLGIGLAFWWTIPRIAERAVIFRLLTFVVFVGGVGRAIGIWRDGAPSAPMLAGLVMELVVTPLLCLWQARLGATRR